jgi:hypothetical protein
VSYANKLRHRMLLQHPNDVDPQDAVGQPLDATGQPIGSTIVTSTDPSSSDWIGSTEVRCLVQERRAKWPEGPGAGPELVETHIFFMPDVVIDELDRGLRVDIDPPQAYQITFVDKLLNYGRRDHIQTTARRIPL